MGNGHTWITNVERQSLRVRMVLERPAAYVGVGVSNHTSGVVWAVPQVSWLRNVPSLWCSCKHLRPHVEAVQLFGTTMPCSRMQTQPLSPVAFSFSRTFSFRHATGQCWPCLTGQLRPWCPEMWPLPFWLSKSGFWQHVTRPVQNSRKILFWKQRWLSFDYECSSNF